MVNPSRDDAKKRWKAHCDGLRHMMRQFDKKTSK